MSILYQMTVSQVEEELNEITYDDVINYYLSLKNDFMAQYQIACATLGTEMPEQILDEIFTEINENAIEDQEEKVQNLFQNIRNEIVHALEGKHTTFKEERLRLSKISGQKTKQANDELNKMLDEVLDENKMMNLIIKNLQDNNASKTNGFSATDILNQVKSYRKKLLTKNPRASIKYYKRTTKGYFREALVHKAFARLNEYLGNRIHPVAIHAGNKVNEKGLDTIYDEYIDFFNDINQSFSDTVSISRPNSQTGFGIQSKSWRAPWERSQVTKWNRFSVSHQAGLFAQFLSLKSDEYSIDWLNSIKFLSQLNNMIVGIGERQVGYVTGANFYWTYQLIANFRRNNYFYAFVFNHDKQPSASTSWQSIENAKDFYLN